MNPLICSGENEGCGTGVGVGLGVGFKVGEGDGDGVGDGVCVGLVVGDGVATVEAPRTFDLCIRNKVIISPARTIRRKERIKFFTGLF